MSFKVPLSQSQVDAAVRLHNQLSQWRISDTALENLCKAFPGFSAEECLLKSVAVNAIYGTNVLAIVRMAKHIEKIMARPASPTAGTKLVDRIAVLPAIGTEKRRTRTSFAAKFCHFFINAEKFPIYDDAACMAIKLHLGAKSYVVNNKFPYRAFCKNFATLRAEAGLSCGTRELDRYLWLTGMYMRWLRERTKEKPLINGELQRLFKHPSRDAAAELDALLPVNIERVFKVPKRPISVKSTQPAVKAL